MKNYFDTPPEKDRKGKDSIETTATDGLRFFQRGLGLKKEVQEILKREYYSDLVEYLRAHDFKLTMEGTTVHLAREFGFCYGVDRAVDYAYQTREKFPDRRIFLTGEIIHNPHVNQRMLDMGIEFLGGQYSNGTDHDDLSEADVVVLPAFGVSIQEYEGLKQRNCILVDTTCGSVLNVWKRVTYYARNGYTSIIHGKYFHEETIATSSQALKYPDGRYLVVRDMQEAQAVCEYVLAGGDKQAFLKRFENAVSDGFDPDLHLQKVGVANQTTMLSSESLAIADKLEAVMQKKHGSKNLDEHFLTFDTICSATQDRQDAVLDLVDKEKLDLMLVIGGFNSSNTNHLAVIAARHVPTYHIADPGCLLSSDEIKHKRIGSQEIVATTGWLPHGKAVIGITAGASTPNLRIGEAIEKILVYRGVDLNKVIA